MSKAEHLNQSSLPELARFSETRGIEPGESFDAALATTDYPVVCFTSPDNMQVARTYGRVIGKGQTDFQVVAVENPIGETLKLKTPGVIPLVLHSATDPVLFQRMFADGPKLGQLLMGHLYIPTPGHESPSLYAVGIANQGLEIMSQSTVQPDELLTKQMTLRRREVLGDTLTNDGFRDILRSASVRKVIAHALGPAGTNISQAMKQYIEALGVEDKTNLVVHSGVEPMAYAEMALGEVEPNVVPIHMECAVYYEMGKMFDERRGEVVFADHHYMPLDAMQLASIKEIEELAASGVMRIATHPSPKPLVAPWVNAGKAEWTKATSNSEAAQMVLRNEVDACVTTGSGLAQAKGLVSRHVFGSPIMLFTIATPLNQEQLKAYR